MRREIVLDLETTSAPQGWRSRQSLGALGISVVGTWSSADDQFRAYRQEDFPKLASELEAADLLIGFSIRRFDLPVLQPHMPFDLFEIPSVDIFEDISEALGHRVSLASLAKATLGAAKSGHGLEAIEWYRAGDWKRLEAYCLQDVRLTRDLYRYGLAHGHLLFESFADGKTVAAPVNWGGPTLQDIRGTIELAYARGRALELDYVSRENAGGGFRKTRKIEIRAIRDDDIEAFDHLRGDVRRFRLGRIIGARMLDEPVRARPMAQSLF